MTSKFVFVKKAKYLYGAENVTVVDSPQEIFKKAVTVQSSLNWSKFQKNHDEYVKDKSNLVLIVGHANPVESRTEE